GEKDALRWARGAVLRPAFPAVFPDRGCGARAPALWLGAAGVDRAYFARLPRRDARHRSEAGDAAHRPRLPGGLREYRSRPEWISDGGAARRRTPASGSATGHRRRAPRPARLQAAIRVADPARARRPRTLAHHPPGNDRRRRP